MISSGNAFGSGKYGFLARVIVMTLATILSAYLLPGVRVTGVVAAIMTALVIGVLDSFIRPVLVVITLPVTLLSSGLFLFVINALLILMASHIVKGFEVDGFGWGLLFSILLTVFGYLLELPNKWMNKPQYQERNFENPQQNVDSDDDFTPYEEVE